MLAITQSSKAYTPVLPLYTAALPEIEMIDICLWDLPGKACDEAGCFWYEDPLLDSGISQYIHRKLRQSIETPILITKDIFGLEAKADCVVAEALGWTWRFMQATRRASTAWLRFTAPTSTK